ncbi:hypothetical protein [Kitasatospora cineracea]|uniref:Thymidylate synthase n=2 Tax=Kitasatospora cineracea TaxID=88074 RepID=A0A3N4SEX7_9ACTN|nr:hypothetical protein [Kitasatospora cineracea]RPE37190.1 hypothetical protein EDD38_5594 [Kitasatospora cineracea]
MHTFTVEEPDVTSAWIAACRALDRKDNTARTGYHTVVRIGDATADDRRFRGDLDLVRLSKGLHSTETVASTIFPAALADRCASHTELVTRYRKLYETIRRYPGNNRGTYFGRLIGYPAADGGRIDQIGKVIDRLTRQSSATGAMTAAYEIDVAHPDDADQGPGDAVATADALVHSAERDNSLRGFPCLSHCSFQLDRDGVLHCAALYRSHFMFERAYGNYLGLGRLTRYVAQRAGLRLGTLTVMAGYAQLDGPVTRIRPLLMGAQSLIPAA